MIGWFLAGALIGHNAKQQEQRRDARRAERARQRRESPMPTYVWIIFGVFAVASIASPPAIPGMVIIGVCIWAYARKRAAEHRAWLASQRDTATGPIDFAGRAAAFDRLGMPGSAQAMRDLRDIS